MAESFSGVRLTSPGDWAAALSMVSSAARCLLLLSTGDIYTWRRLAPEWDNGKLLSFWQDRYKVLVIFFFLFWKECFVFASNRAWIDRIAVWCATLLNI